MEIAVVGINHNNAPIEIREKAAFTESGKIDFINEIMDAGIEECVVLSTCNRSEVYIVTSKKDDIKYRLKEIYTDRFSDENLHDYLFLKENDEAIEHIFNVASGMDSIVLGEDQILGQVKDSLKLSMELGSSKKILNRLFTNAVTAAKSIKNSLKISEIPLSTSYIGLKLIEEMVGGFKDKKVMIIGIGHISQITLKYLLLEDLHSIKITNRTHGKLQELEIKDSKIEIVEYAKRYEMMMDVDIIISATAAPHVILKNENVPDIDRNIYILDLAVPRDIDPKLGERENVEIYDIDDLERISTVNLERRRELKENAHIIIEEYVVEFKEWMVKTKVDPVIRGLKSKCTKIEEDSLEYIFRKAHMENREKKIVQKMMNSALKRVIREPIMRLKEIEDDNKRELYTKVLEELFELGR